MTVRRRLLLPLPLLLVAGFLIPFDRSVEGTDPVLTPAEADYRSLPALPIGASDRGRSGVERSAIELAAVLRAVPVAAGGEACGSDRLRVVWEKPVGAYRHGAVIEPMGPAPDAATDQVNGAVVCDGADFAYMGFEARWAGSTWDLVAVPFIDESDEHVHEEPAPAPLPSSAPAAPSLDRSFTSAGIEGYAAYEPQRTCDPTPKGGTVALQRMLLNGNPGSRNLGISRGCSIGGQSEHKEGRAFDWGVYVSNPAERTQADAFIARLLATDDAGNRHALARRMGVMYVIWNKRIWSAYRAADGWRSYSGASPHTDHVHISLSWAGALGRTSFWSGTVAADLLALPSPATLPVSSHRPFVGSGAGHGVHAGDAGTEHAHGEHDEHEEGKHDDGEGAGHDRAHGKAAHDRRRRWEERMGEELQEAGARQERREARAAQRAAREQERRERHGPPAASTDAEVEPAAVPPAQPAAAPAPAAVAAPTAPAAPPPAAAPKRGRGRGRETASRPKPAPAPAPGGARAGKAHAGGGGGHGGEGKGHAKGGGGGKGGGRGKGGKP